ncbi:MAG: hypothetical protein U0270_30500 [Labilithrix sp.]
MLLVACPKKGGGADGGMDADIPTADTAATTVDAATGTAPTLATAAKKVVKPDAGADGGAAGDAGAVAAGDAGATAADAGATAQTCCCKVGDAYSSGVTQSNCAGTMKGACVAKEECEKRQCCCDAGGKKSIAMQSECTKAMKGKCVAKDQCK